MNTDEAQQRILRGESGPFKVDGLLNLDNCTLTQLPDGISCYELHARNSKLQSLPADIQVTCRIVLDHSADLSELPPGLKTGGLSVEGCNSLHAIPEALDVWFLTLDNCQRFHQWPEQATIRHGSLSLRNCVELRSLPEWLASVANLNVAGCIQLNDITDGLEICGWLDIGGSGIEALPARLEQTPLHWRGVPVSRDIAFKPESITAKAVLADDNAEIRRVMIERMGYLKFATEAGAKLLDQDSDPGGVRQLLKIDLDEDEPLVGLSCFCPSTKRQYFLRVPPNVKSCHQAAAWLAGFDNPEHYNPAIET